MTLKPKGVAPAAATDAQINYGVLAFLDAANICASGSGTQWNLYRVMQALCHDPVFNAKVHRLLGLSIPLPTGLWCQVLNTEQLKPGTWVRIEEYYGENDPVYSRVRVKARHGRKHHMLPLACLDLETLKTQL